ncbi:proline-rich protein 36-like [Notolabrus celidotus]|uniref:proline-rich protein 36-like n=1 Tax=Notolabrus celidotus TaxID=1203425 RepID=UPI0014902BBF|nr:proline-rich protein 36-like [Notolabrus celidotus]
MSAVTLDCRATKIRDYRSGSFTGRGDALKQGGGDSETGKTDGLELSAGWSVKEASVNTATHPAQSEPSPSANSIPQPGISKDGNELGLPEEDVPAADLTEYNMSMGRSDSTDLQSFNAEPEYSVCQRPEDGDEAPGHQLVLMLAHNQSQAQTEGDRSVIPGPSPACAQTLPRLEGLKKEEQSKVHETACAVKDSAQTRMILQGSSVAFTDQPHYCISSGELAFASPPSQPPRVTSDPSQGFSQVQPSPRSPAQNAESNPARPPPSPQSSAVSAAQSKVAPSHTRDVRNPSQYELREPDHQSSRNPSPYSGGRLSSRSSSETSRQEEGSNFAFSNHDQDKNQTAASLRRSSPSPDRARPPSSPFKAVPESSPIPLSHEDNSLDSRSRALPCFLPTLSSGIGSQIQDSQSSSSCRSSSVRAGPPSSPSPLRSPACSSPITSSSAFNRSLAASCISQSISQSLARKNSTLPQAQTSRANQNPSPHVRQRSPSPKLPPCQQGSKDGYHHPKSPPSSPWSTCPSPPPPSLSQRPPSPSTGQLHRQPSSPSPRSSFLHAKTDSAKNANNNNNFSSGGVTAGRSNVSNAGSCRVSRTVSSAGCSASSQKAPVANGGTNAAFMQQSHDPLWLGSHNRVARPFSASEPNSRVQSPSPSPSPTTPSFTRLCSPPPPPQHNYSSPMAQKPPHPRSTRVGDGNPHNPLGLTLELSRAASSSSAFGQSPSCLSPRILSPPPIGVSVNVWTNNVAAPQPRHPRHALSSPSPSNSSSLGSPTQENAFYPTSSSPMVSLRSPRASSPQTASQTLRRSFSSSLADRPPSPARSTSSGARRSWADSSHRSLGFAGSGRGSFDQHESCPTSPRSGWSSYSNSPSCLSPRAGLQSPLSPSRLTPGKGALGGQHFTSVPWPDVRELSYKYNGSESLDGSPSSLSQTLLSSPADGHAAWGDLELEEGHCRSQLICAYVARPACEENLSSSGMTSPPPVSYPHHNYQSPVKTQPQVQIDITTTTPAPSVSSPLASTSASPIPFAHSHPSKQGNQKTSYATTVNLQIAGSGRITSFSTAQVSLTQTLQGGAGAAGQGPVTRRVSINGLSHIPSPIHQSCDRL